MKLAKHYGLSPGMLNCKRTLCLCRGTLVCHTRQLPWTLPVTFMNVPSPRFSFVTFSGSIHHGRHSTLHERQVGKEYVPWFNKFDDHYKIYLSVSSIPKQIMILESYIVWSRARHWPREWVIDDTDSMFYICCPCKVSTCSFSEDSCVPRKWLSWLLGLELTWKECCFKLTVTLLGTRWSELLHKEFFSRKNWPIWLTEELNFNNGTALLCMIRKD